MSTTNDTSTAVAAYNGITIQAYPALAHKGLIATTNGLPFDGLVNHYQAVTGWIFGDVRYNIAPPGIPFAGENVETDLTLLTLDVLSGRFNRTTFADFFFYNEDERAVSPSTHFVCWREQSLTEIDVGLNADNMSFGFPGFGFKGLFESRKTAVQRNPFPPFFEDEVTLLGLVETLEKNAAGEVLRMYAYSVYNNSRPVPTTFVP